MYRHNHLSGVSISILNPPCSHQPSLFIAYLLRNTGKCNGCGAKGHLCLAFFSQPVDINIHRSGTVKINNNTKKEEGKDISLKASSMLLRFACHTLTFTLR
ncbi:hypothetical protein NPIL_399001 [Nephila pilipes]|uniref:Uncharacterized protein n=1 Tax=Nephila pilipes TaxID=299642 RepID=A0A8X6UMP4_NEPPI|nr:hypothetical protein NPIL_399001 [Nephila pilipes]